MTRYVRIIIFDGSHDYLEKTRRAEAISKLLNPDVALLRNYTHVSQTEIVIDSTEPFFDYNHPSGYWPFIKQVLQCCEILWPLALTLYTYNFISNVKSYNWRELFHAELRDNVNVHEVNDSLYKNFDLHWNCVKEDRW